jgi:GTP cyclohydrolase III
MMAGKPSSKTQRALARIAKGQTPYAAAKAEGIALSTIYRAQKRERDKSLLINRLDCKDASPPWPA